MREIYKIHTWEDNRGLVEPALLPVSRKNQIVTDPDYPVTYNVAHKSWYENHDKMPSVCVSTFQRWDSRERQFWAVRVVVMYKGAFLFCKFLEAPETKQVPKIYGEGMKTIGVPPDPKALEVLIAEACQWLEANMPTEMMEQVQAWDSYLSELAEDLLQMHDELCDWLEEGIPINDVKHAKNVNSAIYGAVIKLNRIREKHTIAMPSAAD